MPSPNGQASLVALRTSQERGMVPVTCKQWPSAELVSSLVVWVAEAGLEATPYLVAS